MIAVPASAIRESLADWLGEFWKLDEKTSLALANRPLKEKATEVSAAEFLLKGTGALDFQQPAKTKTGIATVPGYAG